MERTSDRLPWVIVLAGGSGTRLAGLTTDANGEHVPKQYCHLGGRRTLLEDSLARAFSLTRRERTIVIVAAQHERHWRPLLARYPGLRVVVQPENRGTAAGILLPLLTVLDEDPEARVALLPSDHHVEREAILTTALRDGLAVVRRETGSVMLLGVVPDADEEGLGWVLPGERHRHARRVSAFVEKPPLPEARALRSRGALWNSFLMAARAQALLELFHERHPAWTRRFLAATPQRGRNLARRLYGSLESLDFSRDLLTGSEPRLLLSDVPACGWTDLGTPERVARRQSVPEPALLLRGARLVRAR